MNKYENDLTHIRQMMRSLILLLFLLLKIYCLFGQDFKVGYSYTAIVKARSGINMRDEASRNSSIVVSIPNGENITVQYDTSHAEIIEELNGFWLYGWDNKKGGYIFSGFLEIKNCRSDIIFENPHDANIESIFFNSCSGYLGFYQEEKEELVSEFAVKPLKLELHDDPENRARGFYQIPKGALLPTFCLAGLNIQTRSIKGQLFDERLVFPMECLYLGSETSQNKKFSYYGLAKGIGIENENTYRPNFYSGIEKYQLWIRQYDQKSNTSRDFLVIEKNLDILNPNDFDNGVYIFWSGDLNDDNIPDLIIKEYYRYMGWAYYLLLSEPSDSKELYKKIKVGGGTSC
ncbi:MAG TPA: SH3 domain-containing protein [Saprospiraceae bacterium]|nr:SH3 domain-containing protein [Saprospiraceae bacterium]